MELPVVIEPLPDGSGFMAHLVAPLDLSASAATAEEAQQQLAALVQRRLCKECSSAHSLFPSRA